MNIDGIPETIKRDDMLTLISALGLDMTNLISLNIRGEAIEAEMWAVDGEGKRYFLGGGDKGAFSEDREVARHVVTIKVVDE